MSPTALLILYISLGLSVASLRHRDGATARDALLVGLVWPLDLAREGIELGMASVREQLGNL